VRRVAAIRKHPGRPAGNPTLRGRMGVRIFWKPAEWMGAGATPVADRVGNEV
jgi:hypothetical protein